MTKVKKKKYYAIKEGNGVKDKIVTNWDECKKLVLHYPSIYKSFYTELEAIKYLKDIKQESIEQIKVSNKKAIEYNRDKKKKTKPLVGLRIDREVYDKFEKKCRNYNFDMKEIIINMIVEWIE